MVKRVVRGGHTWLPTKTRGREALWLIAAEGGLGSAGMAVAVLGKAGGGAGLTDGDTGRFGLKVRIADVVGHIDEEIERIGIPKDGDAVVVVETRG